MSEQSLEQETPAAAGRVGAGDAGYGKSLKFRHVKMIAIGADGRLSAIRDGVNT